MIDRRKIAFSLDHNRILINLLCHTAAEDEIEDLHERVEARLENRLRDSGLMVWVERFAGSFFHDDGQRMFFEAVLASVGQQCFDARDWLDRYGEWWDD